IAIAFDGHALAGVSERFDQLGYRAGLRQHVGRAIEKYFHASIVAARTNIRDGVIPISGAECRRRLYETGVAFVPKGLHKDKIGLEFIVALLGLLQPPVPVAQVSFRGCSSMVERQLPKLHTRVRFPSPAPALSC